MPRWRKASARDVRNCLKFALRRALRLIRPPAGRWAASFRRANVQRLDWVESDTPFAGFAGGTGSSELPRLPVVDAPGNAFGQISS